MNLNHVRGQISCALHIPIPIEPFLSFLFFSFLLAFFCPTLPYPGSINLINIMQHLMHISASAFPSSLHNLPHMQLHRNHILVEKCEHPHYCLPICWYTHGWSLTRRWWCWAHFWTIFCKNRLEKLVNLQGMLLSDDWHGVSEQWIRNWDSSDRSNGQPLFLPAPVPFPPPLSQIYGGSTYRSLYPSHTWNLQTGRFSGFLSIENFCSIMIGRARKELRAGHCGQKLH